MFCNLSHYVTCSFFLSLQFSVTFLSQFYLPIFPLFILSLTSFSLLYCSVSHIFLSLTFLLNSHFFHFFSFNYILNSYFFHFSSILILIFHIWIISYIFFPTFLLDHFLTLFSSLTFSSSHYISLLAHFLTFFFSLFFILYSFLSVLF